MAGYVGCKERMLVTLTIVRVDLVQSPTTRQAVRRPVFAFRTGDNFIKKIRHS